MKTGNRGHIGCALSSLITSNNIAWIVKIFNQNFNSMLNMPSITDKLDLKGRFLKKNISQSLNVHWLVFIIAHNISLSIIAQTDTCVDLRNFTKLSQFNAVISRL